MLHGSTFFFLFRWSCTCTAGRRCPHVKWLTFAFRPCKSSKREGPGRTRGLHVYWVRRLWVRKQTSPSILASLALSHTVFAKTVACLASQLNSVRASYSDAKRSKLAEKGMTFRLAKAPMTEGLGVLTMARVGSGLSRHSAARQCVRVMETARRRRSCGQNNKVPEGSPDRRKLAARHRAIRGPAPSVSQYSSTSNKSFPSCPNSSGILTKLPLYGHPVIVYYRYLAFTVCGYPVTYYRNRLYIWVIPF